MTKPVRLQLSRRAGFNLQALSRKTNGLAAVKVARRSMFGNPFPVSMAIDLHRIAPRTYAVDGSPRGTVVRLFRDWLRGKAFAGEGKNELTPPTEAVIRDHLRGKNLACWCKPGEPCHADVLLEIANR